MHFSASYSLAFLFSSVQYLRFNLLSPTQNSGSKKPPLQKWGLKRTPQLTHMTDVKHMEGLLPKNYGEDAVEIPGARDLLDAVKSASIPWAIVTSGTTPLVSGWLDVLKLPIPENLIVAEDVENGKPDPSCYLMGLGKLGFTAKDAGDVLVLEDSPAGVLHGFPVDPFQIRTLEEF